jgi:16S rRNA (cytidine1402-2'-O)-methyltransferase
MTRPGKGRSSPARDRAAQAPLGERSQRPDHGFEPGPTPKRDGDPGADTDRGPGSPPGHARPLLDQVSATLATHLARPLPGGLHVVATPIGNLADLTLRALATLAAADMVLCEDTRHSGRLLAHYRIRARLAPYHEHNAEAVRPRLLERLAAGERLALISDAGTPLVSDPGYKLVRAAIEAGYPVHVVPGASAPLAALVASGLPTDAFLFAGFLPSKDGARRARLEGLAGIEATLVFFEAPTRVARTLQTIGEVLGPREIVVARELTKLHEEVARGDADSLARRFAAAPPKGELVLLIGPPTVAGQTIGDDEIARRLAPLLERMGTGAAARTLAGELALAKARVYAIALAHKAANRTGAGPDDTSKPGEADGESEAGEEEAGKEEAGKDSER